MVDPILAALAGKRIDSEALKKAGHQPCRFVDHEPGTNWQNWICPICGQRYTGVNRPYCEDCKEPKENMEARLLKTKKQEASTHSSLENLREDIALLEALVFDKEPVPRRTPAQLADLLRDSLAYDDGMRVGAEESLVSIMEELQKRAV